MAMMQLAPTKIAYVAFLITERPIIVYISADVPAKTTEEDEEMVIEHIMTQLRRSGISIAEPVDGVLLDSIPHPRRSIVGTVHEIIFKINRGEI